MRSRNRRNYEKYGNVFFVTSTVIGFIKIFNNNCMYQILLENLEFYRSRGDINILAYVLMPNHFHLVVKTENGTHISSFMGNFKRYTSKIISNYHKESCNYKIVKKLEKARIIEGLPDSGIWRPRFDSFVIVNENTLRQKIDYIHNNPIRANLVDSPEEWPYSSARNYKRLKDIYMQVDIEWKCLE